MQQGNNRAQPAREDIVSIANDKGPATPNLLRLVAQDLDVEAERNEWRWGAVTAERIRLLAQKLELDATADTNARIAGFIAQLRTVAADRKAGLFMNARDCQRMADALLREGAETAEMLANAGLSAAQWQREAETERNARMVLHREFCEVLMEIEEERAKAREHVQHEGIGCLAINGVPLFVVFALDEGITPSLASDLALLVSEPDSPEINADGREQVQAAV